MKDIVEDWCGYVCVRLPKLSCDPLAAVRGFPRSPPHLGDKFYSGLDRLRWEDLACGYYDRVLPPRLLQLYEELKEQDDDLTGVLVCRDIERAREILSWSNATGRRNELIVFYSKALAKVKGKVPVGVDRVQTLGFDCFILGGWSLLKAGVFTRPEHFPDWGSRLNNFGLFDEPCDAWEYVEQYKKAAACEQVEPIPDDELWQCDVILIGRILE